MKTGLIARSNRTRGTGSRQMEGRGSYTRLRRHFFTGIHIYDFSSQAISSCWLIWARRDFPAMYVSAAGNDPIPPQGYGLAGGLFEHALLELAHHRSLLGWVRLAVRLLEKHSGQIVLEPDVIVPTILDKSKSGFTGDCQLNSMDRWRSRFPRSRSRLQYFSHRCVTILSSLSPIRSVLKRLERMPRALVFSCAFIGPLDRPRCVRSRAVVNGTPIPGSEQRSPAAT